MAIAQNIKDQDFVSIRQAISKLGSLKLGPTSSPTFTGLTLSGLSASQFVFTDGAKALSSVAVPLTVQYGGSGAATLTDHSILLGSGTAAFTALGAATNGQLPIGSTGADPILAGLTGTTNQVTVTNGAGSIALSLPQDIHTGASPTFNGLSLTSAIIWSADTNLYRSDTNILKTDDQFQCSILAVANQGGFGGTLRITGEVSPSSGIGIEIFYGATPAGGRIISYNRTGSAYTPLYLDADKLYLNTLSPTDIVVGSLNGLIKGTSGTLSAITDSSTNWDAAYTHISNNGTDHSYINQSVKTTDAPSFIGLTYTDAELSHPITTYATATTYAKFEPDSASDGGHRIWGFSDTAGQRPLVEIGVFGVADPTDTVGAIVLSGGKSDGGTGVTTLGADETILDVDNWGTSRFKVMGDGALVIGGSETGITGAELEDLSDGGETTLHSHAGSTIASGRRISVYRSSAQSVNADTWTTIQFDTELYDKLNEFDNVTNYTFTPSVTGYYHITTLGTISLSAITEQAYLRVFKNGTTELAVGYGTRGSQNSSCSIQLSKTVYLLSTDSIVMQIYHTDSTARNVTGTQIETYLTIDRVEA